MHSGMDTPEGVGFPIQRSTDRSLFASSPWLIAGYNVFHRLSMPRHPPYALSSFITPTSNRRNRLPTLSQSHAPGTINPGDPSRPIAHIPGGICSVTDVTGKHLKTLALGVTTQFSNTKKHLSTCQRALSVGFARGLGRLTISRGCGPGLMVLPPFSGGVT